MCLSFNIVFSIYENVRSFCILCICLSGHFSYDRIRISKYGDCILVMAEIFLVLFVFFVILTFFVAYTGNASLAVCAVVTVICILGVLFLLLDLTAGIYQVFSAVLITRSTLQPSAFHRCQPSAACPGNKYFHHQYRCSPVRVPLRICGN